MASRRLRVAFRSGLEELRSGEWVTQPGRPGAPRRHPQPLRLARTDLAHQKPRPAAG